MGAPNTVSLKQGYDGRIDETHLGLITWDYDPAYNAHATLPRMLHAGESLCSAVSRRPKVTNAAFGPSPAPTKRR